MRFKPDVAKCLNCKKIFRYNHFHQYGKYCCNNCQQEYEYKTITIPKILTGKCRSKKAIKKYLGNIYGNICRTCGNKGTHNGKELVLQLDHIDGNSDNNLPKNLRLLCPNCHSQTETWSNRARVVKATARNTKMRQKRRERRNL